MHGYIHEVLLRQPTHVAIYGFVLGQRVFMSEHAHSATTERKGKRWFLEENGTNISAQEPGIQTAQAIR